MQALPDLYTKGFQKAQTNSITTFIADVLTILIQAYGKVSDEELQDATTKLRERVFDIAEPLVGMFYEVKELKALSIAAESK